MSDSPSEARVEAEHALWQALQARRKQLQAAGVWVGEKQQVKFGKAHAEGRLLDVLCRVMEQYKSTGNQHNLRGMAEAIKRELPTWEHVLITDGEPWSPYVTPAARRGARRSIEDATDYIRLL